MSKTSLFDLGPEKLNRLLSLGKEDLNASDDPGASELILGSQSIPEKPRAWIGRYKLIRLLGEGGMGMVYLAEQEHPIKRQVALKVIKPGMDSARVIARFEAERQALALLDHPHIAHVYDAGTTEGGRPFFVMEYVKGLPVTEHCDHNKLSIEDRLGLFLQICQAVHHAHQKGIIHRDIKPSNILIARRDGKAIPKIIDFGVAKAIAQPLTEKTLMTEQGQLFGTPEYMSPEQADMASEDIDTRSDIYSLGVLLYVLLTGVLPFDSDTLREGGIDNIRKVIRETDPKTPSTRLKALGEDASKIAEMRRTQISKLARHLKKELEWIPLKAMRKDRAERYRSASELADDIENYLKGAPLIAGPPSTVYRLRKFVHRNRAFIIGVAAVMAVLIVGIVVSILFAFRAERQARISEAISSFLRQDLLASADPSKGKGPDVTVRSFLDTASESLDGKFTNEPLVEASIRDTLGWTYRMLGELNAAEPHLERALQIRKEQLGAEHSETLSSMGGLGWVYCDQGRFVEAERLWAKQLEIRRRVLGTEHPRTLDSMNNLAIAYMDLGRYDEAEQLLFKVVETSRRLFGEEQAKGAMGMANLGQVYQRQGRYDEAEMLYLKSLDRMSLVSGEENPYILVYKNCLAGVYKDQGRYDEAKALFLRTLEIGRRVLGAQHPYTLWSVRGLASLYTRQASYEQAEKLFNEALEGLQKVRGKEHRDTIDCMNGLAELYTAQRRFDEADELLTKALEISSRTLGDDHPWTLTSKNNLAVLYKEQAQYEKSEPMFIQAIEGRRLKLGDTHPHTLESIKNLIDLYEAWNRPEKAEEWRSKLSQTEAITE